MANKLDSLRAVLDAQFILLEQQLNLMFQMAQFGDVRISGVIAGDLAALVVRLARLKDAALDMSTKVLTSDDGQPEESKVTLVRGACLASLGMFRRDLDAACKELKDLSRAPGLEPGYQPPAGTPLSKQLRNFAVDGALDWQHYQADTFRNLALSITELLPATQDALLAVTLEALAAR